MKITLAAIGTCRHGSAEQILIDKYHALLPWKCDIADTEIKNSRLPLMKRQMLEAEFLLSKTQAAHLRICLDEKGDSYTSEAFAKKLGDWRDSGLHHIGFCIGGADGLHPTVREKSAIILSLGKQTWPHLLVRGLLLEQLYRASAILSGHPYHRSG